jgi:hypothetical protein
MLTIKKLLLHTLSSKKFIKLLTRELKKINSHGRH